MTYSAAGKCAAAAETDEKALAIRRRLADDDPRDVKRRNSLAESYNRLAVDYNHLQKPAEAEAAFRQALPILEQLVRDHSKLPHYRHSLAGTHNNLGLAFRATSRWKGAE